MEDNFWCIFKPNPIRGRSEPFSRHCMRQFVILAPKEAKSAGGEAASQFFDISRNRTHIGQICSGRNNFVDDGSRVTLSYNRVDADLKGKLKTLKNGYGFCTEDREAHQGGST